MNNPLGWTVLIVVVVAALGLGYWWQYAHGVAVIIK